MGNRGLYLLAALVIALAHGRSLFEMWAEKRVWINKSQEKNRHTGFRVTMNERENERTSNELCKNCALFPRRKKNTLLGEWYQIRKVIGLFDPIWIGIVTDKYLLIKISITFKYMV